ncbi:MAG: hypothetical protein JW795_09820 [Chitinivibrionales bacterium]|nr:hypothetical protein [Chitinivibrionales bacterium]
MTNRALRVHRLFKALVIVPLFFYGCAVNGIVHDFSGKSTTLRSLHLKNVSALHIYDGNAIRTLPLKAVNRIQIQSDVSKMFSRKLCCRVEVICKDGQVIGSFANERMRAYIEVTEYLCGKSSGKDFCILLYDVSKLEIQR